MLVLEQLRQAGLRATSPRVAILTWLDQNRRPSSVETIWKKVQKRGLDRVTVYRSMEVLMQAGLVRSVDLGHTHVHYEMNDPKDHHHHLVCDRCGDIQDVIIGNEKQVINKLEQRYQFKSRAHSFEMFGLCESCQ